MSKLVVTSQFDMKHFGKETPCRLKCKKALCTCTEAVLNLEKYCMIHCVGGTFDKLKFYFQTQFSWKISIGHLCPTPKQLVSQRLVQLNQS